MKAVLQRVLSGSVSVEGVTVGAIERGVSVLVGIGVGDTADDAEYIVRKILGARMWPSGEEDGAKAWARNVKEIDGGILLISQFTLMHTMKGNKPDFHKAMGADDARKMFESMRDQLRKQYAENRVATGKFQTYMNIHQVIDGPVTLLLDSKNRD